MSDRDKISHFAGNSLYNEVKKLNIKFLLTLFSELIFYEVFLIHLLGRIRLSILWKKEYQDYTYILVAQSLI